MEDQTTSEDRVHSNCGPLSANLHDRAHASRQELSTLSATLSSSLPGGNMRQWLKPDLPGGRYPRLRVFGPSSSHSLQPPDLRSRLGSRQTLSNRLPPVPVGLRHARLQHIPAKQASTSCRSPGTPSPSRCLPWGKRYLGTTEDYPPLPALSSHAARTSGPALAGCTLARPDQSSHYTQGSGGGNLSS
jgi:hypothetical protein